MNVLVAATHPITSAMARALAATTIIQPGVWTAVNLLKEGARVRAATPEEAAQLPSPSEPSQPDEEENPFGKNWDVKCLVCGATPTVQATELCGPCTFGEADTAGGNW